MEAEISAQIARGFQRRDINHILGVFRQYRDSSSRSIPGDMIRNALGDCHVRSVDEILRSRKIAGDDSGIEEGDFIRLLHRTDPIQRWLSSLPLADVVADAIFAALAQSGLAKDDEADGADVRAVSQLDFSAVTTAMKVATDGIERVVTESISKLRESYEALDRRASESVDADGRSKFGNTFKMSCGDIRNFHGGIAERVGEGV